MELGLQLAGGGGLGLPDLVSLARRGESAGFGGIYVPESWRSGFVPVAAIAAATSTVKVGPYVLNAHARTPLATGMSAVDLDQLAEGRLVLGVGSGNQVMNENGHGMPVVRPLTKMRDYLEILRRVTRAPIGTSVSHAGETHSITGWKSQAAPVRESMPILLAATAPRMMELAADAADGIALGVLQSVEFVADIAERSRRRSPLGDDFSVYTAALVSAHSDGEIARRAARQAIVDLFAVKPHPHYERLLRLQGYAGFADRLLQRIASSGAAGAEAEVPDEVVDALTIAGTPAECADQIAKFSGAVDALLVVNVATMQQVTPDGRGSIPAREQLVASYNSLFELAGKVREGATHVA